MNTKVTVKLDHEVIQKAKQYARQHNTSLSLLIENYLRNLTIREDKPGKITPLVKSLSGIIDLPEDYNHKMAYADFLVRKYK